MYETDDLFEASAIILQTRNWHKSIELKDDPLEQRVYFVWEEDYSAIGQQFKKGEMRVCPRAMAKVHATLKKITFQHKIKGGM